MEVRFKRKFTEEERMKFVSEALEYGSNEAVAKKYELNSSVLSRWLNSYRRYGVTLMPKEKKINKIVPNYKKEYLKLQKELKLLRLRRKKALSSKVMRCKNRKVTSSNQLWESDIKYLPVAGEKKTLYMKVVEIY